MISLITSLVEITLSMQALEVELSDMEELTKSNFFKENKALELVAGVGGIGVMQCGESGCLAHPCVILRMLRQ